MMPRRQLQPIRRVAFVSDAVSPYNKGGKETRLHELTTRLARDHDLDVHVYTMNWWGGPRNITRDGVSFHAISKLHPLYDGERRSMRQAILFGLATLRMIVEPFDVVDVDHMPFFPLFSARLVCTLRRKPLVGTWHEVWDRQYWLSYMGVFGLLGYMTERLALRMPHLIVSNSTHTSERLRPHATRIPVVTVPLGVDVRRIEAIPPASKHSDVIFAGRLLRNKNVSLLLDAIALIKPSHPGIKCLIVGEGPERERLEQQTRHLGIVDNVEFMDFVRDHDGLIALLKASRVFALPSEREGFGVVALEANAAGIPVVTVRHPNNAACNVVIAGRNGYVVDLDGPSLAGGIVGALEADGDRLALSPAPDWLREYDWAFVAERLRSVLTTVRPQTGAARRALTPNRRSPVWT
jgi:glycosyltransferase involved in cell wall biosynthesis